MVGALARRGWYNRPEQLAPLVSTLSTVLEAGGDAESSAAFADAALAAVGLTSGVVGGTGSGSRPSARAEACAVIGALASQVRHSPRRTTSHQHSELEHTISLPALLL